MSTTTRRRLTARTRITAWMAAEGEGPNTQARKSTFTPDKVEIAGDRMIATRTTGPLESMTRRVWIIARADVVKLEQPTADDERTYAEHAPMVRTPWDDLR